MQGVGGPSRVNYLWKFRFNVKGLIRMKKLLITKDDGKIITESTLGIVPHL